MTVRRVVGLGFCGLVLVYIGTKIHWGYYEEDGHKMADAVAGPLEEENWDYIQSKVSKAQLLLDVFGEAVPFDREDRSAQWYTWPEEPRAKHFFVNGKYSNYVWIGIGWKGRYSLARYHVTWQDQGRLLLFPGLILLRPWPFFLWDDSRTLVDQRFVERVTTRPPAPAGVKSLFPGECDMGEVPKDRTIRFQVVMPPYAERIALDLDWDGQKTGAPPLEEIMRCREVDPDNCWKGNPPPKVGWKKDGRVIAREDEKVGGGTYQITVVAESPTTKHYRVALYMYEGGGPSCGRPEGWRLWD